MNLTNNDVSFILNQIEAIKKIKGLPYLDFMFKIIDIKKILIDKAKAIQEKVEIVQKERNDLLIKYCSKDKEGKPIVVNNSYQGLFRGMNEEYDTKTEEINKAIKEIGEGECDLSEGEKIRLDSIKIDKKIFENLTAKVEFDGDMIEALIYFTKE